MQEELYRLGQVSGIPLEWISGVDRDYCRNKQTDELVRQVSSQSISNAKLITIPLKFIKKRYSKALTLKA